MSTFAITKSRYPSLTSGDGILSQDGITNWFFKDQSPSPGATSVFNLTVCYGDHSDFHYFASREDRDRASADLTRFVDSTKLAVSTSSQPTNHMSELITDIKQFVKDNRSVIYWIGFALLLDHFVFEGKFRSKLHDMVDKLLSKADKKIEAA